ncbi:helix-turn-helix transcriptional regulator [Solwaraspora sp. WMMA2080]|uniref:helix-turn-helix domain-containing protein n=1 Tax=unclassified Solwaraspora TaxID=2627926 RepID=UPI00248B555B|nr:MULTISPECIES: helix-turn-helix transcriptional regulator [unclassified Solwaraspora]WBB98626.1 helix-turn-helix transcriptional regulator [Solwaraspora sp. WMMA2059]WBC22822.1 helix-turn-helix transcriptional regulator [Solwaraspora sp. WMMA2080]
MVLLRRVIGDALRARRQGQRRTLREVSTAANVSLGYLSEVERGQKEASSELLAAICDALGAQLSEVLRDVSHTVAVAEQRQGLLVPFPEQSPTSSERPLEERPSHSEALRSAPDGAVGTTERGDASAHQVASEGGVTVSVRSDSPLKTTLRASRRVPNTGGRDRDVVCAA